MTCMTNPRSWLRLGQVRLVMFSIPDRSYESAPAPQKLPLQGMDLLDGDRPAEEQLLLEQLASRQLLRCVLLLQLNRLDCLQVGADDPARGRTLGPAQDELPSGVVELDAADGHVLGGRCHRLLQLFTHFGSKKNCVF